MPGGTATATVDLARALADRDDVDLVGVAAAHRHRPEDVFAPPIPVQHLRLPRKLLYESWHRLGRPSVESASGPVDVVHGTGGATPPRGSAPLVVTIHDLAVLHHPDYFTANGRQFLRAVIARARDRADLVICPSRATLEDCRRHGFAPDRLVQVGHGVHPPAVTRDDAVRRRSALGVEGDYVLFVGTDEPRKNLAGLMAALIRLDDPPRLVVVGPEGWGGEDAVPDGLDVHRLGFLSEADLDAVYQGATVFCYPSVLEGFGLPVLEAMARGVPVVTSAGTATEELVGDAGLVADPADPDAIAAALATVLTADDAAHRWGRHGTRQAAARTWERAAAETVAAYRRVVDDR